MIWKVAQTFIDKVDFKVKVATLELEIMITVFENHRKKSHFATLRQNFIKNPFGQFDGQTVLPDRSTLIGQKLVENAKMQHFE